ncbi:MAG: hypothetical protein A4S12_07730 [Proteobacteria bacterium SG_bin5]|nr:BamA/TamA family outer membrane protein [Sphingomonas sp.]OQW41765.1 MAG: hypothetical protein A4S12_07730 [Proteobacteria bacterium SG_bin5]
MAAAQTPPPAPQTPPLPSPPSAESDFDQALPPLDQVQPPPEPAAPSPATPAPSPATPAAPVAAEPELTAPLPPLSATDTTPPVDVQVKDDEKAPSIPYRVVIKGLADIDLEDEFRGLSALLQGGRRGANAAQIGARADEDVQLIERLLRSEGFYDGVATASINTLPNEENRLTVTLTATPGPRFTLGQIAITGAAPEPTDLARRALDLSTGDPIVAAAVQAAEARVALRLPEQGYPFAELGERDILLDDVTHVGDYTLPIVAGPKGRFGNIQVAGDPIFTPKHIRVLRRFKDGDLYDSRKADDLRQALIATSLFSTVSVEPVRTGETLPDGTERVDLLVRQTKGPWRQLAAQAGYGTGEGVKVQGSWTHRNLFPPEGALTVNVIAGTLEQSLGGLFRRSNAGQRDRVLALGASVARQRFQAFQADTIQLTAALSRASTPIFQKRWTWSIGAELLASRERPNAAIDPTRARRTYFIGALPLQLGYDRSNSLLDPTRGFRVNARLSPEAQQVSGGPFDSYARILVDVSGYYPVSDSFTIAGRARAGSIIGAARDTIAPSRRYYAGGGGSVRGFGFQQLGPKDAQGNPIGGRSVTEFALEGRYRFGNFGIVPFIDAGQVSEGSTPTLSGLRFGAGIGARYYTNFGPLRIDVATPIGRRRGETAIALYLSIGQAF